MAQVLDFTPRIASGPRLGQTGLTFPAIYRVTGLQFGPGEGAYLGYTLDPREAIEHRCAEAKIEILGSPQPEVDRRWVMVVHHASFAGAAAYVDGFNAASRERLGEIDIFHTRSGIFTLATREPASGCRPALFIFECEVRQHRERSDTWVVCTESIVIGPGGERLEAEDTFSGA